MTPGLKGLKKNINFFHIKFRDDACVGIVNYLSLFFKTSQYGLSNSIVTTKFNFLKKTMHAKTEAFNKDFLKDKLS